MAIIGSSLPRLGAIERVTGAQQYAADVRLDNTLHVKLVSVDCAHARIVAVHKDEALRVPGVRGVFTAHDLPQPVPRYGPIFADRPMLAVGETKFSGEPVAAVVHKKANAYPTEREIWIVVIGVILFALAIAGVTFGVSDVTGK